MFRLSPLPRVRGRGLGVCPDARRVGTAHHNRSLMVGSAHPTEGMAFGFPDRHLESVVAIAQMAVLAGASGPTSITKWASIKEELLITMLPLPHAEPACFSPALFELLCCSMSLNRVLLASLFPLIYRSHLG